MRIEDMLIRGRHGNNNRKYSRSLENILNRLVWTRIRTNKERQKHEIYEKFNNSKKQREYDN